MYLWHRENFSIFKRKILCTGCIYADSFNLNQFCLADHLALDIEPGFNVLTGETGAGKSLLLDALSAALGDRTDTHYVRYGADKADVTAVFSYQTDSAEAQWLAEHELMMSRVKFI